MNDMQTKVLAEFERVITDLGLDAVRRGEWANTGHVYAQVGFRTHLDISYSFQAGYMSLTLTGPAVDAGHLTDTPPAFRFYPDTGTLAWHSLEYVDGARIEAMFALVADLLGAAAPGRV